MVKKVRSIDSLEPLVDVFEALKRALIKRGFIPQASVARKASMAKKISKKNRNLDPNRPISSQVDEENVPDELLSVTEKSREILFKAHTVFPFTLFPDTVTLDREKVSFAERFFFRVAKVTSVPVRDILSVEADVGPFFGSVHTSSRYFVTNPKSINFLWREDAIKLQRLLQGFVIVTEQEIDTKETSKEDLLALLNDLGKGHLG